MLKRFIVIIATLALNSVLFALEDGDLQTWNTLRFNHHLSQNIKLELEEEFRYGDNITSLYYHHTDGALKYSLVSWFELGVSYRQVFEIKSGNWRKENRPHFDGTFKWEMLGLKLKDRSRLEYRIFNNQENSWRYRNKFSLPLPVSWTDLKLQPFLANEIFYELKTNEFSRNRFYSGFSLKINNTKLKIYYLWQSSKKTEWIDYNIIGLFITF